MLPKPEKTRIAVLKVLDASGGPLGASRIAQALLSMGVESRPRTVRYHLLQMDSEGLTRTLSRRRGREITERGREELAHSNVMDKLGFVGPRAESLTYRMSCDIESGQGTVIPNMAIIDRKDLSRSLAYMEPVFKQHLTMGQKLGLAFEGTSFGGDCVPEGCVGIASVCSLTVNGIMLKHGIPVASRFGGLVEVRDGKPVRFVQLMEYRGVTIDPLEVFVKANMTSVLECANNGSGIIGASFREVPSDALPDVYQIRSAMERVGLAGILDIGVPNRPLLGVDVMEGRAAMIVIGGLNPIAALCESGVRVSIRTLIGLEDLGCFSTFADVALRGREQSPYID